MSVESSRWVSLHSLQKMHKWIGFLVGVQVLLWITGGVVMSAIPIEMVRGNHLIERHAEAPDESMTEGMNIAINPREWESLQWVVRADKLALKAKPFAGEFQFLDPVTGSPLQAITNEEAKALAQRQYTGNGNVTKSEVLTTLPQEVSHLKGQIIRISFNDWINTDFYMNSDSAEVLSVRSDLWRFYDFFWMLHIMDYEYRENFNNWLVITAAVFALIFSVTGMTLLYMTLLKPKSKKYWRKLMASFG